MKKKNSKNSHKVTLSIALLVIVILVLLGTAYLLNKDSKGDNWFGGAIKVYSPKIYSADLPHGENVKISPEQYELFKKWSCKKTVIKYNDNYVHLTYYNGSCNLSIIDKMLGECPTPQEIKQFNTDFEIVSNGPNGEPFVEYACVAGENPLYKEKYSNKSISNPIFDHNRDPRLTLYQELRVMKALKFTKPLIWTSDSLYVWFSKNVKTIKIDYNSSHKHNVYLGNGKISLLSYLMDANHNGVSVSTQAAGLIGGVVLDVHEARHKTHLHTCNSTMDKTINELRAWGVQFYTDYWIANHLPEGYLSENAKESPAAEAEFILQERFCNLS